MQEIKAKPFVNALRALAILEQLLENKQPEDLEENLGPATTQMAALSLREFAGACTALGANVCKMAADELIAKIDSQRLRYAVLYEEVRHLHKYFERELEAAKLLALNPEGARFYDGAVAMFGDDTIKAFPSIAAEVDEAGKCLALERPAAAIFHLMRVVEIGLRCLAKPIGMAGANPDWGQVIRAVDDYIKLPKPQRALPIDDSFLAGVSAQMHAVKLAWRNQAMHVDATFGLANARDIFSATKSLMQHLATQLSE
jgi:hypothetical protein